MSESSFLGELHRGRLRWDLIQPFPAQEAADRSVGDDLTSRLDALLADGYDDPVDAVPELARGGYLGLSLPAADGGLGLSPYNVFRVVRAASTRSAAVSLILSVHNGLGVGAYLPAIPDGPLRDLVVTRLAEGTVCGMADTEPTGAANRGRVTEAVLAEDGQSYLLSGEKVFIGNGRIAGLITVSATVRDGGPPRVGLFVVDTASEGFRVRAGHEFMGFTGAPSAALSLDRVRVPKDRMLVAADGEWRLSPLVGRINTLARMYVTTAPALGIAESALRWSRDFLNRRRVDGRPLAEYDAVAALAASAVADMFAIDSVARWCLLCAEDADRSYERTAAKNIGSMTAWRVVDGLLSVFGAEGYETEGSKTRRGAPAAPIERALRDLRGLRVAGGVDFHVDNRAARFGILPRYYAGEVPEPPEFPVAAPRGARLCAANMANLSFVAAEAARLARACRALTAAYPESELYERERILITVNRIVDELFTMAVVLARASGGSADVQGLATIHCAGARRRLTGLWYDLGVLDRDERDALAPRAGALAVVPGPERPRVPRTPSVSALTGRWLSGLVDASPDA